MYGQILELLIFAFIALFVIHRLISVLGKYNSNDEAKKRSNKIFNQNSIKDVTPGNEENKQTNFKSDEFSIGNLFGNANSDAKKIKEIKEYVICDEPNHILQTVKTIEEKLGKTFSIHNFATSAKLAFKMIIEYGYKNDKSSLAKLVDKRYLDHFTDISDSYGEYTATDKSLSVKISEIHNFPNNILIKVIFSGSNIVSNINELNEEWTFSRNILTDDNIWYLANVERSQ